MRGVPGRSRAQRNDSLDTLAGQPLAQPVRIKCLVADERQTGNPGHENVGFLSKPFQASALTARVRQMLERGARAQVRP